MRTIRTRLSAAVRGLRTGTTYADGYRLGLAHARENTADNDKLLFEFAKAAYNDHMAARVAVDHAPLGQPRLTVLAGGVR